MFQIDKIDYKLISFVAEKKREKLKKETKYGNAFNAVPREGTNVNSSRLRESPKQSDRFVIDDEQQCERDDP